MKKIFMFLLITAFSLSACSSEADFTFLITKAVESMDPVDASYSQTFQLFTDIYLGPTQVNGDNEVVMGGAKSIEVSDDGLVYTINLRDDVKWVDDAGEDMGVVTANDYVYGYQRMVNPQSASAFSYVFEPIKNASAIIAGDKDASELGVSAIDDYTLEIDLANVTPYFESMLALGSFVPQPRAAVEEYGDEYGVSAQTTWYNGPYYVTAYQSDYEIRLTKNPLYINADNVEVETINYRLNEDGSSRYYAFLNDEADYAEITNPEDYVQAKEEGNVIDKLTSYSNYLVLNYDDSAITSNENLRKALAYGLDRDTIISGVFGDINPPMEYIIPKGLTTSSYGVDYHDYSEDSLITYDQDLANKYFDKYMNEMGITDRGDIHVELLVSADATGNSKFGEVVQNAYLQNFGINIDLNVQPFEQFLTSRNDGAFDMYLQSWGPDYADPSTYLSLWQTSQIGGQNHASYSNEKYDAIYADAITQSDVDKRFTEFVELEKMIVDDAVAIPFYQLNSPYLQSPEYNIPIDSYNIISHEYVARTGASDE